MLVDHLRASTWLWCGLPKNHMRLSSALIGTRWRWKIWHSSKYLVANTLWRSIPAMHMLALHSRVIFLPCCVNIHAHSGVLEWVITLETKFQLNGAAKVIEKSHNDTHAIKQATCQISQQVVHDSILLHGTPVNRYTGATNGLEEHWDIRALAKCYVYIITMMFCCGFKISESTTFYVHSCT